MIVYTRPTFKPKKKRKPKGVIAKKYVPQPTKFKGVIALPKLEYGARVGAETAHNLPSLITDQASTLRKETQKYTGNNLIGIATMHKSNMVPVFKQEDAKEFARMRRG